MPSTAEGFLFVLGGLFLLICLVGGGFEVAAAKIPPVGKGGRAGAGIVGAICLTLAVRSFASRQAPAPETVTRAAVTAAPELKPESKPEPTRAEPPSQPPIATVVPASAPAPTESPAPGATGPLTPTLTVPSSPTPVVADPVAQPARPVVAIPIGHIGAISFLAGGTRSEACANGYVWREANRSDHVCVSPHARTRVAQENALAGERQDAADRCREGYVWREAFRGDHVCVEPESRTLAAGENRLDAGRHAP
jgi:hypothetical protein